MDLPVKQPLTKVPSSKSASLSAGVICALFFLMIAGTAPLLAAFPVRTLASFDLDFAFGCGVIQGNDGNLYGIAQSGGDFGFGAAYKITPAGKLTLLASFNSTVPFGQAYGNLIQGADGNFYGTGTSGGTNSDGALFSISPSGTVTTIASFDFSTAIQPGPLIQGTDGNFYGVSTQGGTNSSGNVYQITPAGMINILYSFSGGDDGGAPQGPLIQGTNGIFYGTTAGGGTNGGGTVFALTASGQFTNLVSFAGSNFGPCGSLAAGSDGNFYGTTFAGGPANLGVAFKVAPAGQLTILANFTGNNGGNPQSGLVAGADGNFYGTTLYGGQFSLGTLFRMTPAGSITTLHSFDGKDGSYPSSLTKGEDGDFYGATYSTVFKMTSSGSFRTLIRPSGSGAPTLIRGANGDFYGTTAAGGDFGGGTAFRLSPSGVLTMLASFNGATNGTGPGAGFLEGRNGEFYGTTSGGGTSGGGTIFKMTARGKLTTLVSFFQNPISPNGNGPSSLIQGADGDFYGTTSLGGSPEGGPPIGYSFGTIFKMTPKGDLTTLASFSGTNGANPRGLVRGRDGNFYGITLSLTVGAGPATVFKMTPAGDLFTIFYFGGTNGNTPYDFLEGKDGNFYGTTSGNGSNIEATIFKLTPPGTLTTLVQFDATNGLVPYALAEGLDRNLYYAAGFDGSTNLNQGAIFRITPSGEVLRVVAFNGPDGSDPVGPLPESGGRLYGTTYSGGPNGGGTVFMVKPGSYEGLFYETNNINPKSSGFFKLAVSLELRFTGTFIVNGRSHFISGVFDATTLSATLIIHRDGLPKLTVNIQLSPAGDAITGTVSDGTWTAQLTGESDDYDRTNPTPQAGSYLFALLGSGNGTSSPGNGSSGRVRVATDGTIVLSGILSDKTAINQRASLGTDGQWPLYVSLYHGQGALVGWVTFTNQMTNQFNGTVVWSKTAGPGPHYPNGFTNVMTMQGTISNP